MKVTEIKGDIKFLENEKGKLFQQIKDGEPFRVANGAMRHKPIKKVNGYQIKYNVNGVHGFSIWTGGRNLEDCIWTIAEAERIANEL